MTIDSFDHSVIVANDLIAAERFYREVLGAVLGHFQVEWRGLSTEAIIRARRRSLMAEREGQESQLFDFSAPAPHMTVTVGRAIIPIFLHESHVQEPPPEQLRGTPRLALYVTSDQMEEAVEVLRRHNVAFEGPVEHAAPSPVARSLYFRDPSSNFLELCCSGAGA